MRLLGPRRLARLACLIVVIVWVPGTVALAQTPAVPEAPADAETGAQAVRPIPLAEVPERAVALRAEIDSLLPDEDSRKTLERINSELDDALKQVDPLLARTREALAAQPTVRSMQAREADLSEMVARLRPQDEELNDQLVALGTALERLDAIAADWKATAEVARKERTSRTTVTRISAVRVEIDKARSTLVKRRNRVLAVRDRLVDPSSALEASLGQVQAAIEGRLEGLFRVDQLPIWSPLIGESLREEWKEGGLGHFSRQLQEAGQYAGERWRLFGFEIVLFAALFLGLRSLRRRVEAWAEDDYNLRYAKEVFALPWAMALLITLFLTYLLHPEAPRGPTFLGSGLLAAAALWIGRRFLLRAMAPLAWGLMLVYLLERVDDFLEPMPTVVRVANLVEMAGALGLLLWLQRPSQLAKIPRELRGPGFLRLLGGTMRVSVATLALAIVADLAGWGDLAALLGNGTLRAGYLGFFAFVFLMVIQSLATFALVLRPLRLLNSISRHRLLIRRRLERGLAVVAVGVWATLVFEQLGLLGPVRAGIGGALGAGLSVGALSVSLGDLMAFGVTVWLSFLLARLVRFVLEEDVFTRVQTGRGVPYAVAGLVRYALIFLGFLVGLAAAGFELSKLTVMVGGLGVGIGFGLQNVVNNFVSGLILLFERPIQVGDTVQLPEVWGDVTHIGIRASFVRTFDGAEVIVPNGMLISERVTNWTLSDQRRRVELDVGVAYGTPAQRVIDLLLEVANANSKVLSDPEPGAFFMSFGDSALVFRLRAWISSFDHGFSARSELAVAIQEALDQAGIKVPFPQRDLHLVSVNPNTSGSGSGDGS